MIPNSSKRRSSTWITSNGTKSQYGCNKASGLLGFTLTTWSSPQKWTCYMLLLPFFQMLNFVSLNNFQRGESRKLLLKINSRYNVLNAENFCRQKEGSELLNDMFMIIKFLFFFPGRSSRCEAYERKFERLSSSYYGNLTRLKT